MHPIIWDCKLFHNILYYFYYIKIGSKYLRISRKCSNDTKFAFYNGSPITSKLFSLDIKSKMVFHIHHISYLYTCKIHATP